MGSKADHERAHQRVVTTKMTLRSHVAQIVDRIDYEDHRFIVGVMGEGYYIQIEYDEDDIVTGFPSVQRGRKFYVSRWATDSEIVQTCLTAAFASAEHRVREHFKYAPTKDDEPRAIFGPHFKADALYGICGIPESYDAKESKE